MLPLKPPGENRSSLLLVSGVVGRVPSIPGVVDGPLQSPHPSLRGLLASCLLWLCVLTWRFPLCVSLCPNVPLLTKVPITGLGPTRIQHDLILTKYICQKPYLQISPHSQVPGVITSTYLLGDMIQHKMCAPHTEVWDLLKLSLSTPMIH